MRNPRIFICYAPRAGLRSRLPISLRSATSTASSWARQRGMQSAYFLVEDFYTPHQARYLAVAEPDLHSRWTRDEAMCHELAQLQDAFAREWLCSRADPGAAGELEAYARAELAAGDVMVRYERLNAFSKLQPNWTHSRRLRAPACSGACRRATRWTTRRLRRRGAVPAPRLRLRACRGGPRGRARRSARESPRRTVRAMARRRASRRLRDAAAQRHLGSRPGVAAAGPARGADTCRAGQQARPDDSGALATRPWKSAVSGAPGARVTCPGEERRRLAFAGEVEQERLVARFGVDDVKGCDEDRARGAKQEMHDRIGGELPLGHEAEDSGGNRGGEARPRRG